MSDFYAAYNHYPGLKQRCWAHLLRDVDDLQASYPQDTVLARWATAVHRLYRKAKAAANTAPASEPWLWVSPMQLELEERLLALCRPYYNDQAGATGQTLPAHTAVHQRVVRIRIPLASTSRQQSGGTEPEASGRVSEDQRRHSLIKRHQKQDGAGVPVRRMASKGPQPLLRMPQHARFTLTLNSYFQRRSERQASRNRSR